MPENNFEDAEFTEIEDPDSSLAPSISNRKDVIEGLLNSSINTTDNGVIYEPSCPICTSSVRQEAEDLWLAEGSCTPISNLIKKHDGIKVAPGQVRNHMKNHMDDGGKSVRIAEYLGKVRNLSDQMSETGTSTLASLDFISYVLLQQMVEIQAIQKGAGQTDAEIAKLKSTETARLMAQYANVIKMQSALKGEMRESGELLGISVDVFQRIMSDAFENAKDMHEDAHEILLFLLSEFRKENS